MDSETNVLLATNAEAISDAIEELEELAEGQNYGAFWGKFKEINGLFRDRIFPSTREQLTERFQSAVNDMRQRQVESADEIVKALEVLSGLSADKSYKDFWAKVKEISPMFSLPLARDRKQELRQEFQGLCDKVKEARQALESLSESNKSQILEKIKDGKWTLSFAHDPEDFIKTREILDEAMNRLRSDELIKPDRDECWEKYRNASESLNDKREKRQLEDYQSLCLHVTEIREETLGHTKWSNIGMVIGSLGVLTSSLCATEGKPHEALKLIKEAQQKLRTAFLTKDQRQEIRQELQELWDEAIEAIEAEKEAKRQKHEDWVENQRAWRERAEGARDHKRSLLENNQGFIERLEEQIEDLEEKISESTSDRWIEKAQGWIGEKQEKIAEVQEKNRELQQQIDDIEEKLSN
ncbi:MAG: hypothetical protein Q8R30_02255 [bacterium]|nr:hypothetical protein [bacterium]